MTKKSKQQRRKYRYSDGAGTTAMRRDYVEGDYAKGVFNSDNVQVIRPLNQEELAFLENFYKEEVHVNFTNDEETKLETRKLKELRKKHRLFTEQTGEEHPDVLKQKEKIIKLKKKLGNKICDPDEQSRLYAENYKRNQCLFTRKKASGELWPFEWNDDCVDDEELLEANLRNQLENFGEDD